MNTRNRLFGAGLGVTAVVSLLGVAAVGPIAAAKAPVVITVAMVNNPQMLQMEKLTPIFERTHPGIVVKYVTLPENILRAKVTEDVATHAGKFDVVTIGNYETPIWAKNGWIRSLKPFFSEMTPAQAKAYDYAGLLKPVMASLSYKGQPYSLPFYAESSLIMYRKDLFKAHGLTMPLHPTWQQIAHFAKVLNDPKQGIAGILLRGAPGWGMNLAPFDTVINTFGGEWFNMKWQPMLDTPPVEKALAFYVNLDRKYGAPGAANLGWQQCLTLFGEGKGAMYYDATSIASDMLIPGEAKPSVRKNIGFAYAPVAVTPRGSHWLWSWALAMVQDSPHPYDAFQYLTWATSPQYLQLVAKKFGWASVPPGTRGFIYQNPNYRKANPVLWQITLNSIDTADPTHPTLHPVPYTGIQYVEIPQFESLGNSVSNDVSAAIAGTMTVKQALAKAAQQEARDVSGTGKY